MMISTISIITKAELNTSNSLLGYRAMWQLLRDKYGILVRRYKYSLNYTMIISDISYVKGHGDETSQG